MLTKVELAEIKARCDAATEGPFVVCDNEGFGVCGIWSKMSPSGHKTPGRLVAQIIGDDAQVEIDAAFIAHSREDVPFLLDLLSQAEAERERLEAALKDVIDTICRPGSTADEVFNIAHLAWLKAKETK